MIVAYLAVALTFAVTSTLANGECADGDGSSYRGRLAVTRGGLICQRWSLQFPHEHTRTPQRYPRAGLNLNYCRNPDGDDRPWCYTTGDKRFDYCGVPACSKTTTSCYSGNGAFYRGEVSKTKSGKQCQHWHRQHPHQHKISRKNYPDAGIASNFCRNPDGEDRPWCYTTDSSKRWELCDIPVCT